MYGLASSALVHGMFKYAESLVLNVKETRVIGVKCKANETVRTSEDC